MKIKRIFALTALFMLIAVFSFSLTVFAVPVEDETTAPAAPVAPVEETPQTVTPAAEPTVAPVAPVPTLSPNALTPDGQASILNYYQSDSDDKEFYTITTPAGNVFYLVIDGARGYENVYFLNAVTESDLMALAAENDKISFSSISSSSETCTCTEKCENGKTNADCLVCKNDITKCTAGAGTANRSTSDEAQSGSGGGSDKGGDNMTMYIIIGAAFVLVAGIGIYVKIIKPKKQGASFDDEDEAEDDYANYGEGYDDEHYGSPEYLPEDDYDGE